MHRKMLLEGKIRLCVDPFRLMPRRAGDFQTMKTQTDRRREETSRARRNTKTRKLQVITQERDIVTFERMHIVTLRVNVLASELAIFPNLKDPLGCCP